MSRTVYFADKSVVFTDKEPAENCCSIHFTVDGDVVRAKILKILETTNCIAVVAANPDRAFHIFAAEFTAIEAAGGAVVNCRGEYLMIQRNGRWDLPKGHVEAGEQPDAAAVREVAEETGVAGAGIVRPLCDTLHAYYMHGRWELKRTHWYEMRADAGELIPQTEEGIERVAWCPAGEMSEHLASSFPTIRRVMECLKR